MKEEKTGKLEDMLLRRVREGENEAVSLLYKSHYPAVYHYIVNNHGDDDEAAEIYQQAFIVLYEKLQDASFTLQSSVGTFLYAVARNLWLATLKERRRFTMESASDLIQMEDEDDVQIRQVVEREQQYEAMDKSLELLGEPCKSLLKAFYHEMLSMEQIAANMGYTNADNAKTQKYKCLQRLRKIFEKRVEKRVSDDD